MLSILCGRPARGYSGGSASEASSIHRVVNEVLINDKTREHD